MQKTGILLTNTGTPDAPTKRAVRRYLREFLTDKRIVQLPRFLWLPILYGLVLSFRARRTTKLYQKIWMTQGSPMRKTMQNLRELLQNILNKNADTPIFEVEIGMNYGEPSIYSGLESLRHKKVEKIILLPLFPQYSNTTTASSFDRITQVLKKWSRLPALTLINNYRIHECYIEALAKSVQNAWENQGQNHLVISFHGVPQRYIHAGDPYQLHCEQTTQLLIQKLNLLPDQWTLCYQSQFGYAKWLQPSTQYLLSNFPTRGIKNVDVICPGFAIDCLETLEEILIRGKEIFLSSGGKSFRYISALNDSIDQIELFSQLIQSHL